MTQVTVRYWAGARQAAGTAEELAPAGSLADVLAEVRSRHDARFAQVLAVCSFVVGDQPVGRRDPVQVALADGDVVEVLPPFAGGADEAVTDGTGTDGSSTDGSSTDDGRTAAVTGSTRLLAAGVGLAAGVALAVGGLVAASGSQVGLWLGVLVVQALLVAGWHRAVGASDARGAVAVGAVWALAADVVVAAWDDWSLAPLAYVLGVGFLLAPVAQLARRDGRGGLTVSLAATVSLGALVVGTAAWPVLARGELGADAVVTVALAAAAACLLRALPSDTVSVVLQSLAALVVCLAVGPWRGLDTTAALVLAVAAALPVVLADVQQRRDPRPGAGPVAAVALAVWPYGLVAALAVVALRVV